MIYTNNGLWLQVLTNMFQRINTKKAFQNSYQFAEQNLNQYSNVQNDYATK